MRNAVLKLIAALISVPACMFLTGLTQNGIFMLGSLVGFILSILWIVDLKRQLQAGPAAGTGRRVALAVLAIPQAFLGLTALAIGLAIIGWILYNLLVERQPQFVFQLVALPVPFALVVIGAKWLMGAFGRECDRGP